MRVLCGECRTLLRSRPETDNGVLVEVVQPCPQCRRHILTTDEMTTLRAENETLDAAARNRELVLRMQRAEGSRAAEIHETRVEAARRRGQSEHKPRQNEKGEYICVKCDIVLEHDGRNRGRKPLYCSVHKIEAHRESLNRRRQEMRRT